MVLLLRSEFKWLHAKETFSVIGAESNLEISMFGLEGYLRGLGSGSFSSKTFGQCISSTIFILGW